MNSQAFNQKYEQLTYLQKQVLWLFLKNKKDPEIANKLICTESNVRKHIQNICSVFGLKNEPGEHNRLRSDLIDLFIDYKPELVSPVLTKEIPHRQPQQIPGDPIELSSLFYIERPPIEHDCYEGILQSGALIRIKAAKKMGKTSLLHKILVDAQKQGYRTVCINLLGVEEAKFSQLDKFLRWFCTYVSDRLQLLSQLNDYWSEDLGSTSSCTRYFEMILSQQDTPLVLGLDGVDRIFQYPEINQDFLYLLRFWHEEANNREIWERMRLVVVHCTEDYGRLDINKSPFNVGLSIPLEEFSQKQVTNLVQRYQLDCTENQIQKLMEMVGGHPYLIQLALYSLAIHPKITLEKFLQDTYTDIRIYSSHLRPLLVTLREHSELAVAFQQVLAKIEPIQLDEMLSYKLYNMGLVKWQDNCVIPRCELYRRYFQERLGVV